VGCTWPSVRRDSPSNRSKIEEIIRMKATSPCITYGVIWIMRNNL
jgi:hypothetical protein